MPGIAADQQDGAGHEAAAADPVELAHAGQDARAGAARCLAGGRRGRLCSCCRLGFVFCADTARRSGQSDFLDQRVPFAAGFALPDPAGIGGAAVLAHIANGSLSHALD